MSGSDKEDPGATRTGEHRMLPVGTVLSDRYELVELLGVGGMGLVYRAHDHRLDLDVAVKVLNPERAADRETLQRFERELVLARQVSHGNVVRIHDIGQDGDVHYLTMDLVQGESLKEIIERRGPLPVDETVAIAVDLAEALAAAHDQEVVHRDLKPANVLVDARGRAHITDFGVARSLTKPGLTRTGNVLGTPHYLSPEQALGEQVDGRADIFALGLLVFEMLSGRLPFSGESFEELLAQRVSGRARSLSSMEIEAPAWLQAVIDRCLARDPDDRYASARELLEDLRKHRASPAARRLQAAAVGAVLLVMAAVAGGGWFLLRGGESDSSGGPAAPAAGADHADHSVAVAPFVDETGRRTLAWVTTGVPEMINVSLAESPSLQVVDSLRVFRTLDDLELEPGALSDSEIGQLAGLMNVDRIVTGRVRSTGEALHVEAKLIDVAAGGPPRRFSADAPSAEGLLDAVNRLARSVREALGPSGSGSSEAVLSSDPRALAAYSDGVQRLTRGDTLGAVRSLQAAAGADAHFAAAWVRLADAYRSLGYDEKAGEAAQRAVKEINSPDGRIALQARALNTSLSGDSDKALHIRRRLVERYPNDIEARVSLAELEGNSGELEGAIDTLKHVVERDPNHPRAWYLLGKYSILAGDSQRAIDDYLVRALVIQNRLDNAQGRADVLNALGIAYNQVGDLAQSQENYEKALELRRQIGDRRGVAATLSNLSRIQSLRGDYDGAGERLAEALKIKEDIGDKQGVAYAHNEFGVLEEEQGHYAKALEHYREALKVRQDLGDKRALAESYNNVGYAYFLLGEYDNAAVYAQQALRRYQEDENKEGAMLARQTLAQLETARGNWESALSAALSSLKTSRELDYSWASAVSLGVLARVAFYQGRYGAALDSYNQTLDLVKKLNDPRGQAEYLLGRAGLLLELGAGREASTELDRAEQQLSQSGNREQHAELLRLRGLWRLQGEDPRRGLASLQKAVQEGQESGSVTAGLEARLVLARGLSATGDADGAVQELEEVADEAGRIGHVPIQLETLEELARVRLAAGNAAAALRAVRQGLDLAASHQPYGRGWRLKLLAARAMALTGDEGREEMLSSASEEFQTIRAQVPPDYAGAFEAQPEVEQLHERLSAASR